MAADDVIDEQAMSPIGPKRTRRSASAAAAFGGKAAAPQAGHATIHGSDYPTVVCPLRSACKLIEVILLWPNIGSACIVLLLLANPTEIPNSFK